MHDYCKIGAPLSLNVSFFPVDELINCFGCHLDQDWCWMRETDPLIAHSLRNEMDPSSFSLQSFSWLLLQNLHVRKYERILTHWSDSFNFRFTMSFNILKERKTGCHGTAMAKTRLRQLNYSHGKESPGDINHDFFFPSPFSLVWSPMLVSWLRDRK